jgi:hypothetical protein
VVTAAEAGSGTARPTPGACSRSTSTTTARTAPPPSRPARRMRALLSRPSTASWRPRRLRPAGRAARASR